MTLRDFAAKGEQLFSKWSNRGNDDSSQVPLSVPDSNITVHPPLNGEEISATVEDLGPQQLSDGFVEVERDGGGGGCINGHHIVLFSDTLVKKFGPLTCTLVYSDAKDPRKVKDFGSNGCPKQGIPYIPEEKEYTDKGQGKTRVVIWPQSAIIPFPHDRKRGFAITPLSIQSAPGASEPSRELYNSLYTITANHDGPVCERTVPKLWNAGQVKYGSFTTCLGRDNNLYFVAGEGEFNTKNCGLKLAKATWDTYLDKNKWQFWTGDAWVDTPPKCDESKPFIEGVYSSGDIFFSPYLGTYLAVFFAKNVDSTFRYRYALPDGDGNVSLTGKWSKEFVLHDSNHLKNGGYGFNFAGHAYPHYDPTGKTLVLSTTLSDGLTPFFFRATFNRD